MALKPKLKVSFKERDLGLGHLLREAAKLKKKPYVKVGVTQAKGSKLREDGKKTVADIAQIHEYGAPAAGIPERSFIRSTRTRNDSKYNARIERLGEEIFDADSGMTTERALGLIGQEVSSDVRNTIRAGIPPELKESTIRRKNARLIGEAKEHLAASPSAKDFTKAGAAKNARAEELVNTGGKSTPLIDTGQLVNAINYEVVLDGSAEKSGEGHHE